MIFGRNIAPNANIPITALEAQGAGIGAGSVTGKTYYVDSTMAGTGGGDDPNHGTSPSSPFLTIAYALTQVTAAKGDVIIVACGHTESCLSAGAITCSKSDVTIRGMGWGSRRPNITVGTTSATTAAIYITAAGVTLENLIFTCGVDALVACVSLRSGCTDCVIRNCMGVISSSKQYLTCISVDHASVDGLLIEGFVGVHAAAHTGMNSEVEIAKAANNIEIVRCRMYGDYADACIHNPTSNVATNVSIHHNWLVNLQTGDHIIELVSAVTGDIFMNWGFTDLQTTNSTIGIDPGSCYCNLNYVTNAIDKSGILSPPVLT